MPRVAYKTSWGQRVPGVTTICGLLAKPFLIKWANGMGLKGIDTTKYVDDKAQIGTLAHQMVQDHLEGKQDADYSEYTKEQIDQAENALISFFEWEKEHSLKPIEIETHLVSDELKVGGTIDILCELDGELTLLDLKTGKAIYDEYFVQVAAYRELLKERGHDVKKVAILRIGRDETEGFEVREVDETRDLKNYFAIFKNLLEVYELKKMLNWR